MCALPLARGLERAWRAVSLQGGELVNSEMLPKA